MRIACGEVENPQVCLGVPYRECAIVACGEHEEASVWRGARQRDAKTLVCEVQDGIYFVAQLTCRGIKGDFHEGVLHMAHLHGDWLWVGGAEVEAVAV